MDLLLQMPLETLLCKTKFKLAQSRGSSVSGPSLEICTVVRHIGIGLFYNNTITIRDGRCLLKNKDKQEHPEFYQ